MSKGNTWEDVVYQAINNLVQRGFADVTVDNLIKEQANYMAQARGSWPKSHRTAINKALKSLVEKNRIGEVFGVKGRYRLLQAGEQNQAPVSQINTMMPNYTSGVSMPSITPSFTPSIQTRPMVSSVSQATSNQGSFSFQQRNILERMLQEKRRELTKIQEEIAVLEVALNAPSQTNVMAASVQQPTIAPVLPSTVPNQIQPMIQPVQVPTLPVLNAPKSNVSFASSSTENDEDEDGSVDGSDENSEDGEDQEYTQQPVSAPRLPQPIQVPSFNSNIQLPSFNNVPLPTINNVTSPAMNSLPMVPTLSSNVDSSSVRSPNVQLPMVPGMNVTSPNSQLPLLPMGLPSLNTNN